MQRKPIRFSKSVPANSSITFSKTILADCTIERQLYRFPPGPGGTLKLEPWLEDKFKNRQDLLLIDDEELSEKFLAEDNFVYDLKTSVEAPKNSVIKLKATNTDLVNAHQFDVLFEVDELGGLLRPEVIR